jgi:cilia- and flagella-associated protein 65
MGDGNVETNRAVIARQFGIDCGGVRFYGGTWTPGGEYIRQILVKNVTTSTVRLRYALPRTKFFYMAFPNDLVLAAGNNVVLEVRFRPIRYEGACMSVDRYCMVTERRG